ncbi:hypothetical protein HU724_015380 [Pseudomonas iranensis]|uniref:hypothetical protein n=1 Tax=Pseudomonas iranensis TaxID=2745503 RepID=UPI0016461188|nr:hypothetical protein [Pseudomonas iranensis]QXI20423.1 hypothetical protein HU724_015380 [Pseudomonas iranensis]
MTLNDDSQDENTFTLFPAKIPLAIEDVISDPAPPPGVPVVGLPLGIFKDLSDDNTGANALKVLVDPPPPNLYTKVSLWINGVQSGVPQDVGNEVLEFIVFQTEFRDGIINVIQYKLETKEGNESESTKLWTLYSANRPGGNAPTGTGPHPELQINLPALLGDPALIGKTEVDNGVLLTCSYTHGKAYDLITYEINRKRYSHKVMPTEAGKDISILIDRAKFEQIGSLNDCPFSYTVDDQLHNGTHNERWSKYIYANIDLERVFLPMPLLREKAGDNTDDPKIVDLKKLDGHPLFVVVLPNDALYQKDDWVKAYYRLDDSPEEETKRAAFTVDDFGALNPCIVYIPNEKLVSGKRLQVRFQLERPEGTVIGTSRIATAKVIGSAQPQLQPPKLLDPAENPIDVLKYEQGVSLQITFLEAAPGDHAQLVEDPPFAGSVPFPSVPFNASKTAEFQLPSEFLVTRRGSTRKFRWTLIRNSIPSGESPDLTLVINAIATDDPRLPTPNIAGELGQQLTVSDLPTDARVLSDKVPLMQQTHPVWIDFEGVDVDGKPATKEVSAGGLSELVDRISLLAPVEWLEAREHGSELRLACAVNLDGIKDKMKAVPLRVRTYTMSVTQALEIDRTPMVLDGPHFFPAPAPYTPTFAVTAYLDDNAHRIREALGGVHPYHYSSSNTNVASVNATTGDVVSTSNGTARIDVRDAKGDIVGYEVVCKNVYELVYTAQKLNHSQAAAWMGSIGAQFFPTTFRHGSSDPLIRAAAFGFQKTGSAYLWHWHTSELWSSDGLYGSSVASAYYIAQWQTPPYVAGVVDVGNNEITLSLNSSIGYRLRNR